MALTTVCRTQGPFPERRACIAMSYIRVRRRKTNVAPRTARPANWVLQLTCAGNTRPRVLGRSTTFCGAISEPVLVLR